MTEPMTWASFKRRVDEYLAGRGLGQDTKIWYLDLKFPCEGDGLQGVVIGHGDGLGLCAC